MYRKGSEPPADPWIGEIIAGRYRIVARLAEGGMGRVYVAEHVELQTRIAIKVLPIANQPKASIERFRREARAASRLRSPHVARAFDFGQLPDGSFFFAMELLVGEDLSHLLAREELILPERAISILRQVANALDAAHALGFVHRDLKPGNIFIEADIVYDELVKVLDFGIAKQVMRRTDALTAAGSLLGTPQYMAPEQVGGEGISPRTDVYSLAAVAFEMLTGELPHEERGLFEMLEALVLQPSRTPSEVGVVIEGLDDVMKKALAIDPAMRHASAGELVDDLERVLLGGKASARRSVAPPRPPEEIQRQWPSTPVAPQPAILRTSLLPPPREAPPQLSVPSTSKLPTAHRWYIAASVMLALAIGLVIGSIVS